MRRADPRDRDASQVSGAWIDRHGRFSGPVENYASYDVDFYVSEACIYAERARLAAQRTRRNARISIALALISLVIFSVQLILVMV